MAVTGMAFLYGQVHLINHLIRLESKIKFHVANKIIAADKFEVASCMRHCSRSLRNFPMTPESA
jgi:hypothetical protein